MKKSNGIELSKFSIEKILKKYEKWFFLMCGDPGNLLQLGNSGVFVVLVLPPAQAVATFWLVTSRGRHFLL